MNGLRHIAIGALAMVCCGAHAQLTRDQMAAGCVVDGRLIRCPSSMRHVEAQGIKSVEAQGIRSVEAQGIRSVEAQGINRVEAQGIKRYEAQGIKRYEAQGITRQQAGPASERYQPASRPNSIDAEAAARGKAIDPQGRGLTQAQIDAMEMQRRLMWNATGGNMVYR